MNEIRFQLALTQERFLAYYQGAAQVVMVTASDGRKVQIPASALRRFITANGIQGEFLLRVDANNKLISIDKVN